MSRLAGLSFAEKKRWLRDHFRRVMEGVAGTELPVAVHLETHYGPSEPAFEAFAEMLEAWPPGR